MPDIIHLLPEYLANQIAAGEVVACAERARSVAQPPPPILLEHPAQ